MRRLIHPAITTVARLCLLGAVLALAHPGFAANPKAAPKKPAPKKAAKPAPRAVKGRPAGPSAADTYRFRRMALERAYAQSVDQLDRDFARRRAELARNKKAKDYKKRLASLDREYKQQRAARETAYQKRLAAIKQHRATPRSKR